jgi:NADH-quinone oxidoreductase subunit G
VGANPLEGASVSKAFLVAQELFPTETAKLADVVLPAAAAYEKTGSFTNVCGEVQRLKKGPNSTGTKSDLEIMGLIARQMGQELSAPIPEVVFEEIRRTVPGYNVPYAQFVQGMAVQTGFPDGRLAHAESSEGIRSSRDTLFSSGTLGRYSRVLQTVIEKDMVEVEE